MLIIPATVTPEIFRSMLHRAIGGAHVDRALCLHFNEGRSIREIADTEHMPHSTLTRQMTAAEKTLRRLGLWPHAWTGRRYFSRAADKYLPGTCPKITPTRSAKAVGKAPAAATPPR